ncbi:MAG: hypothetical protein R3248_00670 [Candidatus Promineifilaceae bacterium]|nr:hypothetical protein [Candidatus Promineifilaceae bacterium]
MAVKLLNAGHAEDEARSGLHLSGQVVIGLLFLVALFAFEIFNFDTTQYALENLLGDVSFAGLRWAAVLAIAFCAIDFAGLLRFFLPEAEDGEPPTELWYLMGAWLLVATMNALMTWWAVSLTLLTHDLGNEVLSRQQLLEIVPIFVAVLVWLTRILFIGAFTVAGGYLFDFDQLRPVQQQRPAARPGQGLPVRQRPLRDPQARRAPRPAGLQPVTDELPPFLHSRKEDDEKVPAKTEKGTGARKEKGNARPARAARRTPARQEA